MRRITLIIVLCASPLASASSTADDLAAASAAVKEKVVTLLAARDPERRFFSRARPAPTARRVRLLDAAPETDARGALFLRFAIDTRRGFFADDNQAGWQQSVESGCVYIATREVLVRRGENLYPPSLLSGKTVAAAATGSCEPAATAATPSAALPPGQITAAASPH